MLEENQDGCPGSLQQHQPSPAELWPGQGTAPSSLLWGSPLSQSLEPFILVSNPSGLTQSETSAWLEVRQEIEIECCAFFREGFQNVAVFCRSLLHDWVEEPPGAGNTCGGACTMYVHCLDHL